MPDNLSDLTKVEYFSPLNGVLAVILLFFTGCVVLQASTSHEHPVFANVRIMSYNILADQLVCKSPLAAI